MAEVGENTGRFKFEAAPITMLYPVVITPKPMMIDGKAKGDPMYQVQASIPPDHPELPALKAAIARVAKEKFGTTKDVSLPLKLGDAQADRAKAKKRDREFMRGQVILTARGKQYAPALSYVSNGVIVEVGEDMRAQVGSKFYSGVEGTIEIVLVAYDGNGKNIPNSVVAYLTEACSLCRGKKLGGSGSANKFAAFAKNMGEVSDLDPTDDGGDIEL